MKRAILCSLVAVCVTFTPMGPPAAAIPPTSTSDEVLFHYDFPRPDQLVTNQFGYWNPGHPDAHRSDDWAITNGSLFSHNGYGYTGVIDYGVNDPESEVHTNSAMFRLNTMRKDFGNVKVSFDLNVWEFGSTSQTPPVDWDGVHIWLRYQSQYQLYYFSVARRDGSVVIKKKCPGGRTNGGTYHELTDEAKGYTVRGNLWRHVAAAARNNADGSVTLSLYINGALAVSAVDDGIGCAAISRSGSVGIRGDNTWFLFDDFTVTALD